MQTAHIESHHTVHAIPSALDLNHVVLLELFRTVCISRKAPEIVILQQCAAGQHSKVVSAAAGAGIV